MPNYFYTAKSFDGQTKTGTVFAKDINQLASNLKSENMLLIKAVSDQESKKNRFKFFLPSFGISSVSKIMLVRNLWVMFGAGLSLVKIFSILGTQAKKQKMKSMMLDIANRLNKGETFSEALSKYPAVFNEFFLNMVRIGEESGTLENIFEILSLHMDKEHEIKSKIKGALIYPCVIVIVMGIVGAVVSIFVIPRFTAFLLDMNVTLPIYTRILIWLGNFSKSHWYLYVLMPIILGYTLYVSVKTKSGRWARDTFLIKIPFLSSFIKKTNSAILIRSLSSLNSAGISLIRSLEITSATVGNVYFKNALNQSIEKIKKGERLSSSLRPYQDIFPFGTIDMMEVGEETGKTTVVLKKLSEFYEQEVIEEAKNFSTIIEPVLLVFLGLVVAFFAISIIEPMYSSLTSIVQ